MRVLVFDTETTGLLPNRFPRIASNLSKYPHIVQLSYLIYDTDTHKIVHEQDDIIMLPEDVEMPEKATEVHGITKSLSTNRGIHIESALEIFALYVKQCQCIVAHNIDFDMTMIDVEGMRTNMQYPFTNEKIYYCTMNKTKELCNLVRKYRNVGPNGQLRMESYVKKPTLNELHQHLFKRSPKGLHDALIDVRVCFRCFLQVVYNKVYEFSVANLALEK
jgi:DNA polymerase III epsilon subunit-like protein